MPGHQSALGTWVLICDIGLHSDPLQALPVLCVVNLSPGTASWAGGHTHPPHTHTHRSGAGVRAVFAGLECCRAVSWVGSELPGEGSPRIFAPSLEPPPWTVGAPEQAQGELPLFSAVACVGER